MAKKHGAVRHKKRVKDGITFASSLEHYCYCELKKAKLDFEYEGEKIELLPSFKTPFQYYKSTPKRKPLTDKSGKTERSITYTPDFVSHKHKFYIETKGFVPSQHTFNLRWKMFLNWMKRTGKDDYKVFLPRNQEQVRETIDLILDDQ